MIRQMPSHFKGYKDVFLPSVYDALLLIRATCDFRDGRLIRNYAVNLTQYLIELAFNDGHLFAIMHLIPDSLYDLQMASLFLLIKSYPLQSSIKNNSLCIYTMS